jgi:hypothetical protein
MSEPYRCSNYSVITVEDDKGGYGMLPIREDNGCGGDVNAEDNDVGSAEMLKTGSMFIAFCHRFYFRLLFFFCFIYFASRVRRLRNQCRKKTEVSPTLLD